jgi:hypothetical protein
MDELDSRLRARLAALANAVPVAAEPARLTRLSRPVTRPGQSGYAALATATGVVLVVVLVVAVAGRGGPPTGASPVPVLTPSPVATSTSAPSLSPSAASAGTPASSAAATRPPADVALPYPDGCPAYGLSPRRCAYIVDWALAEAGVAADGATVQLLGDPLCEGEPAGCVSGDRLGGGVFLVRVRVTPVTGQATDHPVFCGLLGEASLRCADAPLIRVISPMSGYHDVSCGPVPGGEPGSDCATPLPTIAPPAAGSAVELRVSEIAITIDRAGAYSIDVGGAVLPNGILSEASATLANDRRSDVLIPDGIHVEVVGEDGQPLRNAYDHGWRPGTERVRVHLVFTVESFDPGATLEITDVIIR